MCDVDFALADPVFKKYPNAKTYKDFRVMLDEQKDIDAVIVATPDHTHAVIAMAAMARKKHVYVQKPLTHSVSRGPAPDRDRAQVRGRDPDGQPGALGRGHPPAVRVGVGRRHRPHPRGARLDQPAGVALGRRGGPAADTPPVPAGLDWDLWLGPAHARPYHPTYHPAKWRAWWDFGTGSLGDMACHIVDPLFWALKLKYPVSVEANVSKYWKAFFEETQPKNEMFPRSTIVRFKFPAREGMPEVQPDLVGRGLMPARPAGLEPGRRMGDLDGGILLIGDKGAILANCYGESPRIVPESMMKAYKRPGRPWSGSRRAATATRRTGFARARAASPPAPASSTRAPCRRRS